MTNYNKLLNNLENLELHKIRELLPLYLDKNINENKSFTDIFKELTDEEINFRDERAKRYIQMASD